MALSSLLTVLNYFQTFVQGCVATDVLRVRMVGKKVTKKLTLSDGCAGCPLQALFHSSEGIEAHATATHSFLHSDRIRACTAAPSPVICQDTWRWVMPSSRPTPITSQRCRSMITPRFMTACCSAFTVPDGFCQVAESRVTLSLYLPSASACISASPFAKGLFSSVPET